MSRNWRARVEQRITHAWLHQGVFSIVLRPFSTIYSTLSTLRRWLFQVGVCKSTRLPIKVIVVGNVIAGGAGKTPTVIAVAEHLARVGYHVGVISRGYGRKSTEILEVRPQSLASEVGDEPLLMQTRLNMPMFVGSDRITAARCLLQKFPQVNAIVCDDGIQHLQLFRDAEVYVFDNRGVGNGLPLPSGPLRSPWPPRYIAAIGQSAKKSIVLHTGSRPAFAGHRAQRSLASWGRRSNGTAVALNELQSSTQRLIAVAGIAQPSAFFEMLASIGIQTAQNMAYADHYHFANWVPPTTSDCIILCTEKDAVKIWQVDPTAIAIPLIQTMDPTFFESVQAALAE